MEVVWVIFFVCCHYLNIFFLRGLCFMTMKRSHFASLRDCSLPRVGVGANRFLHHLSGAIGSVAASKPPAQLPNGTPGLRTDCAATLIDLSSPSKASVVNPKRMVRLISFALWFQPETGPTLTLSCFQLEQLRSVSDGNIEAGSGSQKVDLGHLIGSFPHKTVVFQQTRKGLEIVTIEGSTRFLPMKYFGTVRDALIDGGFHENLIRYFTPSIWSKLISLDTPVAEIGASQVRLVAFPLRGGAEKNVSHTNSGPLQKNDPRAASSRAVVASGVKWMQMERIECWAKALKSLNLSALSKADPNRFNADRRSHHLVSLTFQDHINDSSPLHALAETSAPHCLRWGTRSS